MKCIPFVVPMDVEFEKFKFFEFIKFYFMPKLL